MAELTAEQVAQRAFDQDLLDDRQLQEIWGEFGRRNVPMEEFVQLLLRRELLTNFQLDRLLKGERAGYFYGDYKVLYMVSGGSFARVYRAVHKDTGVVRAVKVLRKRYSDSPEQTEHFCREGQVGLTLRHPNIVPIYEVYSKGMTHFLVLEEAARVGLRVVCPPPKPAGLEAATGPTAALKPFDARYDPVLAWRLGQGLTQRELAATERWAEEVLRADGASPRPLVCDAESEILAYSRISSMILMPRRSPAGTSFELADYGAWLHARPRLALPGTPFWTTIQTQMAPQLLEQVSLLGEGRARTPAVESEQIELLVQSALAAGARGLAFASRSPLDADDQETRQRARTLELVNRELELIEAWAAAGALKPNLSGVDSLGENPGVAAAVLQTDKTRLLLPMWLGTSGQFVPGQSAGNRITFIVPGAPESHKALEIVPGGLRPVLKPERKRGGMHILLEEFSVTAMVLLTDDVTISRLTRQAQATAPRVAKLARDLAVHKFNLTTGADLELVRSGHASDDAAEWLNDAKRNLEAAEGNLAGRNYRAAVAAAERAMRPLRMLQRDHWERAAGSVVSPSASPFAASFATLPRHWTFLAELDSAERSPNLLPESGMENVYRMARTGWSLYSHPAPGVRASGELLGKDPRAGDPYAGDYSFHLSAAPIDPEQPPELLETPPLWLVTPRVAIQAGQWVRMHGWVRVPRPITGSLDGLLIFDSIGGEPLAERIGETSGWKEFTLYRAAPATTALQLTLALTGLGEAWIDDLSVEILTRRPPGPRPSPFAARRLKP